LLTGTRIITTVARQLVVTWQAVRTQIVVRGAFEMIYIVSGGALNSAHSDLKCYHPSMKRIRSPSTELSYMLAVYIIWCACDLDL